MGRSQSTVREQGAAAAGAVAPGVVLLVDDEPLLLRALERILRVDRHRIRAAAGPDGVREALVDPDLDAVLLDLFLDGADGIELLEWIKGERPDVEVVMMTGHASVQSAVGCMRRGAFDYLEKPFEDVHRVRATVSRAVERRRLVCRNRALEAELQERHDGQALVGVSPAIRRVLRLVDGLRHNESIVLITGESGTGKELVARALHAASPRRGGPFVPVDCGALPETIIESELFGHERGAFTGAVGAPGLFRMAEGGTLFLDEIGEIPPSVQAKLLRALQHKEVRPVGGSAARPVDLRVVCATNRDLAEMVRQGRFRQDLFYRLHVIPIPMPPLRERPEDVPVLAHHFLAKHRRADSPVCGFEPEALARLAAYEWPGNVRELENAVESAVALARAERLRAADFPLGRSRTGPVGPSAPDGLPLSLEAYERCALERALRECAGDATAAARRLGIGRSTFYRKLARHRIEPRTLAGRDAALSGPRPIR